MRCSKTLKFNVKAWAESLEDAVREGGLDEYFEDVCDVEVKLTLNGKWRGAKITLTLGGPNIFFDTRDGWVKGYWGADFAECHIQSFATDAIDDFFAELWYSLSG